MNTYGGPGALRDQTEGLWMSVDTRTNDTSPLGLTWTLPLLDLFSLQPPSFDPPRDTTFCEPSPSRVHWRWPTAVMICTAPGKMRVWSSAETRSFLHFVHSPPVMKDKIAHLAGTFSAGQKCFPGPLWPFRLCLQISADPSPVSIHFSVDG